MDCLNSPAKPKHPSGWYLVSGFQVVKPSFPKSRFGEDARSPEGRGLSHGQGQSTEERPPKETSSRVTERRRGWAKPRRTPCSPDAARGSLSLERFGTCLQGSSEGFHLRVPGFWWVLKGNQKNTHNSAGSPKRRETPTWSYSRNDFLACLEKTCWRQSVQPNGAHVLRSMFGELHPLRVKDFALPASSTRAARVKQGQSRRQGRLIQRFWGHFNRGTPLKPAAFAGLLQTHSSGQVE